MFLRANSHIWWNFPSFAIILYTAAWKKPRLHVCSEAALFFGAPGNLQRKIESINFIECSAAILYNSVYDNNVLVKLWAKIGWQLSEPIMGKTATTHAIMWWHVYGCNKT